MPECIKHLKNLKLLVLYQCHLHVLPEWIDQVTRLRNLDVDSNQITDIPSSAEIESAELRVYQVKTIGTPFTAGKILLVDHLNYGNELTSAD